MLKGPKNFWMQDKVRVKKTWMYLLIYFSGVLGFNSTINQQLPHGGVETITPKLLWEGPIPLPTYHMPIIPSLTKCELQLWASLRTARKQVLCCINWKHQTVMKSVGRVWTMIFLPGMMLADAVISAKVGWCVEDAFSHTESTILKIHVMWQFL